MENKEVSEQEKPTNLAEWLDSQIAYAEGYRNNGCMSAQQRKYWDGKIFALKEVKDALDDFPPSPAAPEPERGEGEKKAAVKAIWKAIMHFQDVAKEEGSDLATLTCREIESELYDVLEQIDPTAKRHLFPTTSGEEHIHVSLPSGAIANVSPDASPELLGALDKMCELAANMPEKAGATPGEEKTLGQMLKEARECKGFTPKSVLDETGVSNEYLRKLEADEIKTPSAAVLWKLAQYYSLDLKPLCIKAGIIIKKPSPGDGLEKVLNAQYTAPPPLPGNDVEGEVPETPKEIPTWIYKWAKEGFVEGGASSQFDAFFLGCCTMYRKMQEENCRHENARNRAQDRCLELRKELRTASAKAECADVEIKHLSALNRGLYDQIAYLQTALAGQKGKAEEADIEVLVVKNGSWEMQKYLTDLLSAANTRIESLKELSEGWERQYHQAEGRIESLTEELALVQQFRDNVAGERDEYPG